MKLLTQIQFAYFITFSVTYSKAKHTGAQSRYIVALSFGCVHQHIAHSKSRIKMDGKNWDEQWKKNEGDKWMKSYLNSHRAALHKNRNDEIFLLCFFLNIISILPKETVMSALCKIQADEKLSSEFRFDRITFQSQWWNAESAKKNKTTDEK